MSQTRSQPLEQSMETKGRDTRLTHIGNSPFDCHGFVNPPIVRGSTVLFPDAQTMATEGQAYTYGTHGTPTTTALGTAVNALEGSAGTILVPSGLAAVTIPLLAFASAGDHVLLVDSIYGPTRRFANQMLARLGVDVEYYAPDIGPEIKGLMRSNTRVVFTESPGSNTFELQDIDAIADIAHAHNAVVMMDNTWATPLFYKPLDHGVDISIHAATKYPAGHSDVLMGFVSANEATWERLDSAQTLLGTCVSSDDAYQVLRSMRSMGIRLDHHQKSAIAIAQWLETHPAVERVLHPGLESHPQHALFKRDFKGSSGLFSIVLKGGGRAEAHAFLNELRIFGMGYSWGGYESLAVHVSLADRTLTKGQYSGPLIRLQIGLENIEDLKEDIARALAATKLG